MNYFEMHPLAAFVLGIAACIVVAALLLSDDDHDA